MRCLSRFSSPLTAVVVLLLAAASAVASDSDHKVILRSFASQARSLTLYFLIESSIPLKAYERASDLLWYLFLFALLHQIFGGLGVIDQIATFLDSKEESFSSVMLLRRSFCPFFLWCISSSMPQKFD